MPQVIIAAVAAIGLEVIGGATLASVLTSGTVWAKIAFSAAVSLVGQSLSRADTPQAPMSAEAQSRKQLVRASADPRRVVYGKVQVSGTLLYASNGTDENYVHLVIALAGHSCHQIGDIWLGDELLGALDAGGNCTAGRFAGFVRVRKHLGSPAQAADADLNAECPEWGAKNRPLKGIAYVYLRIKRSRDVFPNGLPTPRFELWGKNDILDPRTGLRGWQDNAALCSLDYILSPLGFNSALDEVAQSTWIAAANVCDEPVNLPAGGTQKRYTVNGSFTLDSVPVEVLDEMRCAMAGCASYSMGLWEGHAGAASAPVMDLSENDLRGSYKVRPRPSRARLYNAVKGTYISATDRWTETDFPPVTNFLCEGQDGGERIYKDVKLPFTTCPYMAQRIAKSDLERHRQGIVVEFPARIAGLKAKVWDVVRLSIAQQGWVQKQFRVVDKKISLFGGADLVLEEYSPTIYTMPVSEQVTVDPAPDTALASPFTVSPPSGLTLTSGATELLKMSDGTVISRIKVSWTPPRDAFIRRYIVGFQRLGATWDEWQTQTADGTPIWLSPVEDGARYDVRVQAENSFGVRSAYAGNFIIAAGKTAPPSNVPWFSADGVNLSWGGVPDIDLAGYLLRWLPGSSRDWGQAQPLHSGAITASPWVTPNIPVGVATLLIKAVDTSGNESLLPAAVTANLGDPLIANIITTRDLRGTGFPGQIGGGSVSGGNLLADSTNSIWNPNDAALMWSADAGGAFWDLTYYKALTYRTTVTVDGAEAGSQMTIASTLSGDAWRLEYRRPAGDAAPMWGGADASWASDDNAPMRGNAPGWMPWTGAIAAEAGDYEIRVRTAFGRSRGRVDALSINFDVPDITEYLHGVSIAAGGARLAPYKSYHAIRAVHLTLQDDGGAARTARVMDKSLSGPLIKTFDSSNAATTGHVDAIIQGY